MTNSTRLVKCACGCGERFKPITYHHKYATQKCKNRAMQRKLRQRARELSELRRGSR